MCRVKTSACARAEWTTCLRSAPEFRASRLAVLRLQRSLRGRAIVDRRNGSELRQGLLANPLQIAYNPQNAARHPRKLHLAFLPDARHGRSLGIELLAHHPEAVDHGLNLLSELRAGDVLVDERHLLAAPEVRLPQLVHLDKRAAQRFGERAGCREGGDPYIRLANERL